MKNVRGLILSLLIALVATFAQCRYVESREKSLLFDSEPMKTLVSTRDIPPRVRLDETMVELVDVPRRWQQPKAVTNIEDVIGQITSVPIFSGEQVLKTKLVTAADAGLAFYVPKGSRAIALAVDVFNAVGGHIKAGNRVDILGSFDFGTGDKSDLRTITVMQDVQVLSVVDDIGMITARQVQRLPAEGAAPDPDDAPPGPAETLQSLTTITVAVSPEFAQKLAMAQELGHLTLVLRGLHASEGSTLLEAATVQTTLGIPEPVRFRSRPSYRLIEGGM